MCGYFFRYIPVAANTNINKTESANSNPGDSFVCEGLTVVTVVTVGPAVCAVVGRGVVSLTVGVEACIVPDEYANNRPLCVAANSMLPDMAGEVM